MAVVQNAYTGDGTTVLYSLSFLYLDEADVKVSVNGSVVTNYIFATASSIQFLSAPANGASIIIYRETDNDETSATIFPGSAIKAADLNNNFTQILYIAQELVARTVSTLGATMSGILNMGGFKITNLGTPTSSTDASTKGYVDATVSAGIPDGDKGDITVSGVGTVFTIDNDVITDANVSPTAAISGGKITPHFGNQHVESSSYFAAKDHGEVRFYEDNNNGDQYVGFKAPALLSGNLTWTLPGVDAAVTGYALVSDGSGNLSWGRAGGATGGGTDDVFYENAQTVTTNYTLTTNKNAMSAGPITIDSGVTVTIPSGQFWSIV
jgi:hypothetical protein